MKMNVKPLTKKQLESYLKIVDLTDSKEPHAIRILYERVVSHMRSTHQQSDIKLYRKNPIVTVADNYDNLLIAKDNISRSSTYTHYVNKKHILRTHTSAHLPKILRSLANNDNWNDVLILLPGLAYRRDVSDKKHVGEVHMLEMWRIIKNSAGVKMTKNDLLQVVNGVATVAAPGWNLRIEDSPHPYTNEGIEVNAVKDDKDIEILECGLIKEQILLNAGLNPNEYSGWALGMGLDRLVMTIKNMADIRYLRSSNPKITTQMTNLDEYIEVSNQPAIVRDLSYSVPKNYVDEDISADIREAMATDAGSLEEVQILSSTNYDSLPKTVKARLGINKNQKNVLVRITLRHLERTLTNKEVNKIYTDIYPKINKGDGGYI